MDSHPNASDMASGPHSELPSELPTELPSRALRFTTWWEALPVRWQFAYGYLASLVLLLIIHVGGIASGIFPNLPVLLGIGYAFGEAILFAGLIVFATRTEIMRKARIADAKLRAQAARDLGNDPDGGAPR